MRNLGQDVDPNSHAGHVPPRYRLKTLFARVARLAGLLLYWSGLYTLVIGLGRGKPKILVYHACEPEPGPATRGLGINTPPTDLESQLDYLARNYRIVSLAELEANPEAKGTVTLTFDDGYRSVFTHAFPLIRDRGLTATIYLVTDTLDDGKTIWVNELAWWINTRPDVCRPVLKKVLNLAPGEPLAAVIEALRARYDEELVQSLLTQIRSASPEGMARLATEPRLYVRGDEIDTMAAAGFTFGSHTRSHPNLARLPIEQQGEELATARDALAQLPGSCGSLAYPFGSYGQTTRNLCAELGFSSVMEVGGVNSPLRLDRTARVPIARGGAAELFVQMEIIAPLKALVHGWFGGSQDASP